jgi:transcription termination/antitermination protein NusG
MQEEENFDPGQPEQIPAQTGDPSASPDAQGQPFYDPNSPRHWFIIHTYSGFEQKVAESLRTRAEAFGFADKIGNILIPTEEVVELRNGKKVTSKRLVYPGYVLVEMEMNDELWHAVKATPRVTGFVGGGTAPVPLSADEVNQILNRQATAAERPKPKMTFDKGDPVRIVDGPFANFSGKVDEINPERGTMRVMVTIFGRATPVELEFLQVEKA